MALAKTIPKHREQPPFVPPSPIYYPESDGEPMAETDTHRNLMVYLIEALMDRYRGDPQVYVAGNLFMYYAEGDPTSAIAPDVFVVFGVPKGNRRVYKVWEEGQGPDVVIELTSKGTMWKDRGAKKGIYEALGVTEYFLYDPLREYLSPPLQGYRLAGDGYRRIEERPLVSGVLGLELRDEEGFLRLYEPRTGEKLLTPLEAQAARRQAEAELEHLRAELAALRGK